MSTCNVFHSTVAVVLQWNDFLSRWRQMQTEVLTKKIWNIVDCRRSEKKIQNSQEIKRTLFNWTKQDKMCKFSRKSSFSSYIFFMLYIAWKRGLPQKCVHFVLFHPLKRCSFTLCFRSSIFFLEHWQSTLFQFFF